MIVFLAVTVLVLKYDLISANVLKSAVVASYTIIAILIFAWNDMIDWKVGLIFGVGQAAGGYITAEFASNYRNANFWAFIVLVVVIILAILSSFEII